MNTSTTKKGFTLVELLIVIAILAVLATAAVLVLNPAELLKQARDSTRISDINTLNSAMSLYLTDQVGAALTCGGATSTPSISYTTTTGVANGPFFNAGVLTSNVRATSSAKTDGTGWVTNINFGNLSSSMGNPIAKLPVDPVNSATYFYAYNCSSTVTTYEFDAKMESVKYGTSTSNVVTSEKDGGNNDSWYEVGNAVNL